MEYRIPEAKHDRQAICTEIGQAAGQQLGGWSILHDHEREEGFVWITLPDGVITQAQLDAIAAQYPKSPPPSPPPLPVLTAQEIARLKAFAATLPPA